MKKKSLIGQRFGKLIVLNKKANIGLKQRRELNVIVEKNIINGKNLF